MGGVEQHVRTECCSFSVAFLQTNFASTAAILMKCNLTALSSLRKGPQCGVTESDTGGVLRYEQLVSRAEFHTLGCLRCGWSLDNAFFSPSFCYWYFDI